MTEQLLLWPLWGPLTSMPQWSLFSDVPGVVPEMKPGSHADFFLTDVRPPPLELHGLLADQGVLSTLDRHSFTSLC